jgi:hypothetical protein
MRGRTPGARVRGMAAANPLPIERSELDAVVEKLRARAPLTEGERALVRKRGEELIAGDFTDPPPGVERVETTEEEDDQLLEDEVVADADARQGRRGTPWREVFAALGIPVPPPGE